MSVDGFKPISSEELNKIGLKFRTRFRKYLKKNKKNMFSLKGAPKVYGISTTFGPYIGKTNGLYLSKNEKIKEMEEIKILYIFKNIQSQLNKNYEVEYRSNLIIENNQVKEIEIIPMAFRGEYLLIIMNIYGKYNVDEESLIRNACTYFGTEIAKITEKMGYRTSHPVLMRDIDEGADLIKKMETCSLFIDLQFVEKKFFVSIEKERIDNHSESGLESKIGYQLIKEGMPFLVQFEIKSDYPSNKSKKILAKPDFLILDSFDNPVAVFCDSRKYHARKKGQSEKDKKIDDKLKQLGFGVVRLSEGEINNRMDDCIEKIKNETYGYNYSLNKEEMIRHKISYVRNYNMSNWENSFIKNMELKIEKNEKMDTKEERIISQIYEKIEKAKWVE